MTITGTLFILAINDYFVYPDDYWLWSIFCLFWLLMIALIVLILTVYCFAYC